MVSWPARSSERPSGALELVANRALTAALAAAMTVTTTKDQRQEP